MASFGSHGVGGPSLDLDLLPGTTSSTMPSLPYHPTGLSDMDKSLMTDIAANAMEELLRLLQTNEPLWIKSATDGRDVLNLESYERIFPRATSHLKNPDLRIEASRDSGVVIMNGLALVEMFMDPVISSSSSSSSSPQLYICKCQAVFILITYIQVFNNFMFAEQVWGAISNNCLNGKDNRSNIIWNAGQSEWVFALGKWLVRKCFDCLLHCLVLW